MAKLWLDFETYSDLNIKEVGGWAYAMHWSTEVLMAAWAVDDEPVRLWEPGDPVPAAFRDTRLEIWSHNAEFEFAIWNFCFAPFYAAALTPERVYCTAAQASLAGLPRSLEAVADFLQVPTRKDKRGKELIKMFCVPQPDGRRKTKRTHPIQWKEFKDYCIDDVKAMRQSSNALPPFSPFERRVFIEHLKINARGIGVDATAVAKLWKICREAGEQYNKTEYGKILNSPVQIRAVLSIYGIDVDDIGAKTIEPLLDKEDLHPAARKLIIDRLGSSKASIKKLKRAMLANAGDNRLRGMHVYYGAHTGRFSGALVQVQNLTRDTIKDIDGGFALLDTLPDDPIDAVAVLGGPDKTLAFASSMIRPCLVAHGHAAGRVLIARDYNAIEARMLAWLANAESLLRLYRAGEDPYRYMAERVFGIPYAEIHKDSFERFVGKQMVLGCGYGMGAARFVVHCAAAGLLIEYEQARIAVKSYRESAPEVPELWYEVESAVDQVMDEHRAGHGRYCANNQLIFYKTMSKGIVTSLRCLLPSGRTLVWLYPAYVQIPGRDGEGKRQLTYLSHSGGSASVVNVILSQCAEHKLDPRWYLGSVNKCVSLNGWTRITVWGGTFVENIIQALSRDLLVAGMLRIAAAGYEIVLHVHDEIVVEAPRSAAPQIQRLLDQPEPWCPDAFISVEGWEGVRYRK